MNDETVFVYLAIKCSKPKMLSLSSIIYRLINVVDLIACEFRIARTHSLVRSIFQKEEKNTFDSTRKQKYCEKQRKNVFVPFEIVRSKTWCYHQFNCRAKVLPDSRLVRFFFGLQMKIVVKSCYLELEAS